MNWFGACNFQLGLVLVIAIGLAVGVVLTTLGISTFFYGLRQPIRCEGSAYGGGCGNIPEFAGLTIAFAGLATLGGTIAYGVSVWQYADSEAPDD